MSKKDAKRLRIPKKVSGLFAYKAKITYFHLAEKFILSYSVKKTKPFLLLIFIDQRLYQWYHLLRGVYYETTFEVFY